MVQAYWCKPSLLASIVFNMKGDEMKNIEQDCDPKPSGNTSL